MGALARLGVIGGTATATPVAAVMLLAICSPSEVNAQYHP
jgi:hypothetical protein